MEDTRLKLFRELNAVLDECRDHGIDGDEMISEIIEKPIFPQIKSLDQSRIDLTKLPIDEMIAMYIAERNALAVDRHAWDARDALVKEHMAAISHEFLDRSIKAGNVESFKTAAGTAYKNTKRSFNITGWDQLTQYVRESGNFQVFQKRLSPNAVKDIESTDGALPPGIEPYVEIEFAVRSPVARKSSTTGQE